MIGRILKNRYRLAAQIGQGGMGVLYRARDLQLERQVAIKILRAGSDVSIAMRFQQEARIIAGLQHPHILQVLDYGQADDLLFMVLPLAEGGTLYDRIHGKAMPLDFATNVLCVLTDALAAAHEHDPAIVHRDLKPSNVLYTKPDAHILLADFGIAKILGGESTLILGSHAGNDKQLLTRTGVLVGTPEYMSPEQAGGSVVDARSDVYALGVMLYEMLSGATPFHGATAWQTLELHASAPVPSLRKRRGDLSDQIEYVVTRALAKRPEDRFQNVREFWDAWQSGLAGNLAVPEPKPSVERIPPVAPKPRPFPAWWIAAAAAVVVVIALAYAVARNGTLTLQAEAAYQQGIVYANADTPQLALIEFDKALAFDPSYKDAAARRDAARLAIESQAAIRTADRDLADGRYCEAIDRYDSVRNRPEISTANVFRAGVECGRLRLYADEVDLALARFDGALSLPGRSEDSEARALQRLAADYRKGLDAFSAGQWDRAIAVLSSIADRLPRAKPRLAQSYVQRGRQTKSGAGIDALERAVEDFERADRVVPDNPEIRSALTGGRAELYQAYVGDARSLLAGNQCASLPQVEDRLAKATVLNPTNAELAELQNQLAGQKQISLATIANSRSGFSGTQGKNGWFYLITVVGNSTALEPINFWNEETRTWYTFHQWVRMEELGAHPGFPSSSNSKDIIRRWRSPATGRVHIYVSAYKLDVEDPYNPGDGVTVYLRYKGAYPWSAPIRALDTIGVRNAEVAALAVNAGDDLDFGIDPRTGPGHDYTAMEITVKLETQSCTK
ncbi:MAG: protein kinase [Chloroflexi bacterium]|nr:protein kinase [Chloroflexota bacterium]